MKAHGTSRRNAATTSMSRAARRMRQPGGFALLRRRRTSRGGTREEHELGCQPLPTRAGHQQASADTSDRPSYEEEEEEEQGRASLPSLEELGRRAELVAVHDLHGADEGVPVGLTRRAAQDAAVLLDVDAEALGLRVEALLPRGGDLGREVRGPRRARRREVDDLVRKDGPVLRAAPDLARRVDDAPIVVIEEYGDDDDVDAVERFGEGIGQRGRERLEEVAPAGGDDDALGVAERPHRSLRAAVGGADLERRERAAARDARQIRFAGFDVSVREERTDGDARRVDSDIRQRDRRRRRVGPARERLARGE
mmetsp:Transcript_13634/g.54663  ORF Transcript_13634/g.54663 Transcript_13634/m.54663 type:complete len:311 (-) Transcript_13634:377-1309(-)